MIQDERRQEGNAPASPLAIALTRWQHAAGDYWPYVCAAPFVSGSEIRSAEPPSAPESAILPPLGVPFGPGDGWREGVPRLEPDRRQRIAVTQTAHGRPPPSALREAVDLVSSDDLTAIFVDLPPTAVLRSTAWLNLHGFVVIPVIQRWVASPAVLNCRRLVEHLVGFGELCRRPTIVRGVVFVLDGERAGRRKGTEPVDAFDNRYAYSSWRFPPAGDLRDRGINSVRWVSQGGVGLDLQPYVAELARAGLQVVGLGANFQDGPLPEDPVQLVGPTQSGTHPEESEASAGRPRFLIGRLCGEDEMATTFTPSLSQGERDDLPGAGQYRRFVRRAQTRALLADHLVQGEPYPALDALVLTTEDDAELRRLTDVFSRAFDRAARILAQDVPLLEEMGFPWVSAELLRDEEPRLPLIGRFDFVRDESGHWWLLEFNADTPSGVREAIAVEEALLQIAPSWQRFLRPNAGLSRALTAAFVEAARGLPKGTALGLVTNASELEDLAQMAFTQRLVSESLMQQGVPVILGDVDNLRSTRSGLRLGGHRVGALYRCFSFESMFGTRQFAAICDAAAAGQLRLLNGLFGLLLQHKGLMSWLWSHRTESGLSAEERAVISQHLPPTWNLAEWDGVTADETGPDEVVVKQVFGREGEEVFFGDRLAPERWELLRRRRTYIVQKRVEVRQERAAVPTASGIRATSGYATVGSFAVRGQWAGYYTRFGGRIVTSRAKWLATLVNPAT